MEVSFLDLREKEVINVFNGKRLGRIIDIIFDASTGKLLGLVVPGDKKVFRRGDDLFVPLNKLKRIGGDVILVGMQNETNYGMSAKTEKGRVSPSLESYYSSVAFNGDYEHENFENSNSNNGLNKKNKQNNNISQGRSNSSYVRVKPLERRKYK